MENFSRDKVRDWVAQHALMTPEKLALVDQASGRRFTYSEFHHRVGCVAGHLKSLGVTKGDRVGFLSPNSTDIVEFIFACWRIGAVSLALNNRLTAPELAYIINDAQPSVIFVDKVFAPLAEGIRKETKVDHWIEHDGLGGETEYERSIRDSDPVEEMTLQVFSDQCMLMYSSGTTGKPKGVIITHEMMLYATFSIMPSAELCPNVVGLAVMPLFHIGALNVFTIPIVYVGGTSVILRTFEIDDVLSGFDNDELPATHFLGVPAIYNALMMHPKGEKTDFSRLKYAMCGAEAVPPALIKAWLARGVIIQEGYGMTETCAVSTKLHQNDIPDKIGSAGKRGMHMELKIMRDDGEQALPNEQGEIWMRGPLVTPGYWNKPEAQAESFVDGWFKSGDIGRLDEDQYLYIEDRKKDMYISGGENVYPAEIEATIYELPEVSEVSVVGVPDDKWGEAGCAFVVAKPEQTLDEKLITAHCEARLARFKHPRYIKFIDALPRTATGKVLKYELRASAPEMLGLNSPQ